MEKTQSQKNRIITITELVDEIFARCKPKDTSRLIGFGFNKTEDGTLLFESQIEPEMRLRVNIRDGRISGAIIDENFNDEFVQIDDENNAYSRMLNEKCRPILLDIKEKCFEKSNFLLEQNFRLLSDGNTSLQNRHSCLLL